MIAVKGLKYGSAVRFKNAKEAPFTSIDDASTIICPQKLSSLSKSGTEAQEITLGEDCLRLSIFSPSADGSRAVLVWVHGGGFVKGSGLFERYDGSALAMEQDIVVVCISYRVGAFGFLPGTGNPGLGDIVCALDWVRHNIAGFGGDPSRISICGQSAGAYCIANLISTAKRPLFRNAILLSPPLGMPRLRMNKLKKLIVKQLEDRGESLTGASAETLLSCQMQAISELGASAMPFCTEKCNRFPSRHVMPGLANVLVTTQANDASPFVPAAIEPFATKVIFEMPAKRLVSILQKKGISANWRKLDWNPGSTRFKACHTLEVSLLLGSWENWHTADMLEGADRGEWERESKSFKSLISSYIE